MIGLRVGVEIQGPANDVASTMATVAWMEPEQIQLDTDRSMVLLSTSFADAVEACTYAERRIRKSATGMGLEMRILSCEAFPPVLDLRERSTLESRGTEPESRF
jgi:hypothetical protein